MIVSWKKFFNPITLSKIYPLFYFLPIQIKYENTFLIEIIQKSSEHTVEGIIFEDQPIIQTSSFHDADQKKI